MQWPRCWHLIVLADDKGRAERLEKWRRRYMIEEDGGRPVPMDWSKEKPWTSCFKALALDNEYWDEQVRHPAASWLVSGGRGVALAPHEQVALAHLPGGLEALEVDKEEGAKPERGNPPRQKVGPHQKDQAGAGRAGQVAEVEWWRTSCRFFKGEGKGKSKDQAGVQICYSFANGSGPVVAWNPEPLVFRLRRGPISVSIASLLVTETVTARRRLEGASKAKRFSPTACPKDGFGDSWMNEKGRGQWGRFHDGEDSSFVWFLFGSFIYW